MGVPAPTELSAPEMTLSAVAGLWKVWSGYLRKPSAMSHSAACQGGRVGKKASGCSRPDELWHTSGHFGGKAPSRSAGAKGMAM